MPWDTFNKTEHSDAIILLIVKTISNIKWWEAQIVVFNVKSVFHISENGEVIKSQNVVTFSTALRVLLIFSNLNIFTCEINTYTRKHSILNTTQGKAIPGLISSTTPASFFPAIYWSNEAVNKKKNPQVGKVNLQLSEELAPVMNKVSADYPPWELQQWHYTKCRFINKLVMTHSWKVYRSRNWASTIEKINPWHKILQETVIQLASTCAGEMCLEWSENWYFPN